MTREEIHTVYIYPEALCVLEKKDYIDKFEDKLKDLKKRANLKGFRPGMVPLQILKNMYGKGILLEEINKIVSEKINNFINALI